MLWVCGHQKYFNSFSAGAVFIGQILMYKDGPRAVTVNRPVKPRCVVQKRRERNFSDLIDKDLQN